MDVAGVDEEREVDELLEDKTDTVTDNPELMAKLREAWQMIWPVDVIVEWVERQPAVCSPKNLCPRLTAHEFSYCAVCSVRVTITQVLPFTATGFIALYAMCTFKGKTVSTKTPVPN